MSDTETKALDARLTRLADHGCRKRVCVGNYVGCDSIVDKELIR